MLLLLKLEAGDAEFLEVEPEELEAQEYEALGEDPGEDPGEER